MNGVRETYFKGGELQMGNFNQEEYLQELYKATWYKMAYLA